MERAWGHFPVERYPLSVKPWMIPGHCLGQKRSARSMNRGHQAEDNSLNSGLNAAADQEHCRDVTEAIFFIDLKLTLRIVCFVVDCNRLPRRPGSQPQPLKNPETLNKPKQKEHSP
jgi:hypothetical protein